MAAPATADDFLDLARKSRVLDENRFQEEFPDASELPSDPRDCAARLVRADLLTTYQANQLLAGKHRGFHLGSYKILRPIGQGGMGIVYLAEHSELRRKVALKVLTGDRSKDKGALERFLREARAAAALDHPNIVRIHDVCQQSQVRFLVMEYVEGESLEAVLKKGGAISQSRSVDYISQAAVGLQHAYEKGFVHRDIKPANLMLTRDGTIKILDMGLARSLTNPADSLTEVLEDGAVLGTADYIAPEQAMGSKEVDIRADIYSLGATFFALVTGKPPFSGTTTQKLAQHQMKEAPSLTAIDKTFPPGLADVVDKMLEKKPGKRYQTPADVVAALAEWLPDTGAARVVAGLTGTDEGQSEKMQAALTGIVSGTSKRIRKSRRRKQRKQLILIGAAAGAAVLVGVVVTLLLIGGKTDEVGPGPGAAQAAAPPNRPAPAGLPGPSRPAGPVGYDRSQDRPDGLVGHWRFDSPVTQEAKDLSGLEQTAILDGTIDWSRADGRPALVFSGDYGLVRIPDHPRLRFRRNESFTLMVWVKPPEELVNGAWQGVVTKPRGRQDGWYGIWLGNFNGERRWVYGSTFRGDNMANLVGSRVVDGWQHVCIVQNHAQRTRRIYVDGLDVCVDGRPGPAKDSDGVGDLLIGGATILTRENTEVVEQFRGSIAEVRLYSRALTPEEILKAAQER